MAGHELGRQVLRPRAERENLLDVVWLAASPTQVRQLWQKVAELLGEEPTHLEREALRPAHILAATLLACKLETNFLEELVVTLSPGARDLHMEGLFGVRSRWRTRIPTGLEVGGCFLGLMIRTAGETVLKWDGSPARRTGRSGPSSAI